MRQTLCDVYLGVSQCMGVSKHPAWRGLQGCVEIQARYIYLFCLLLTVWKQNFPKKHFWWFLLELTNPFLKEAQTWTALHLCRVNCHGTKMDEGSGESFESTDTSRWKQMCTHELSEVTNASNSLGSAEDPQRQNKDRALKQSMRLSESVQTGTLAKRENDARHQLLCFFFYTCDCFFAYHHWCLKHQTPRTESP